VAATIDEQQSVIWQGGAMSVHVDEIQTHVIPTSTPREDQQGGDQQRLGAAAEAWTEHYRLARRDGCRTAAHDFDD
jgi:hypothetical protein